MNAKTDFNSNAVVVQPIDKGMVEMLNKHAIKMTHIMNRFVFIRKTGLQRFHNPALFFKKGYAVSFATS